MDVHSDSPHLPATDALGTATTVAIVVHGIGDHTPVDILHEALKGPSSIWGAAARTTQLEIEGIPIPEEVDLLAFQKRRPVALEILVNSHKLVLLPVIWSGVRRRAGRLSAKADGPMALWVALPLIVGTCFDVLRCVPRARGAWKLGVLSLAILISVVVGGLGFGVFYLSTHLPLWLGSPFNVQWYSALLAVGSFALMGFLITKFAVMLDLVGDVAWYVSHSDLREQNIQKMGQLIQFVAQSAVNARIVVVGHSLGSVLIAQSLAKLPPSYAGTGRTILVTLGSPLLLMSRVFPRHIESPSELCRSWFASEVLLKWVNLWRTKDIIGQALRLPLSERFTEASIGIGWHPNYWGDERLWASLASIIQRFPAADGFDTAWHALPLAADEERQLSEIRWRLRLLGSLNWSMLILALMFQMAYLAPWEKQFTLEIHALILLSWNVGLIPLGLVPLLISHGLSQFASQRDLLHKSRFFLELGRTVSIASLTIILIIASICAYSYRPVT